MAVSEIPLVVVDTDPGTDDAIAIYMLLNAHQNKRIRLIGLTSVAGNSSVENTTRNTLRILDSVNQLEIPVYRGASEPLIVEPNPENYEPVKEDPYFGTDGFGNAKLDAEPDMSLVQKEPAFAALVQLAQNNKGKLRLICIGPLTNVALAMKTDPEFVCNLRDIYIMGGNFTAMGNITPSAEFNFHFDPEAAHIVLANAKNLITLVPLETCFKYGISYEWRVEVLGKAGSPQAELMNKIEHNLLEKKWHSVYIPCDAAIVAVLLKPDIVTVMKKCHLTVELHGTRTRGQVVMDHLKKCKDNVMLVDEIDMDVFKQMLLRAVNHSDCTLTL